MWDDAAGSVNGRETTVLQWTPATLKRMNLTTPNGPRFSAACSRRRRRSLRHDGQIPRRQRQVLSSPHGAIGEQVGAISRRIGERLLLAGEVEIVVQAPAF